LGSIRAGLSSHDVAVTSSGLLSPAATRVPSRPAWRDPRLLVGVLLVCASVVVGARVLASADDTVPVLVASRPLAAGERLEAGDADSLRVRFADAEDADRYLPADAGVAGSVLLRPVGAGELVPRAALGPPGDAGQVAVPLPVDATRVPGAVRAGSVVDVWAGPDEQAAAQGATGRTRRLLRGAPVLSVDRPDGLGPGTVVQVVVGIPQDDADGVARAVAGLSGASLLLVARDG
jgi:Flp pilus assembly protein CpaB